MIPLFVIPAWPRYRFLNNWRGDTDYRGFVLFNVWRFKGFYGFLLLNFGIEYYRAESLDK